MNNADDLVGFVDDGKMLITGAVEAVESERAENFRGIDINDGGTREHDFIDAGVGKLHDSGDDVAFALVEDGAGSVFHEVEEFGDGLGSSGSSGNGRCGDWFGVGLRKTRFGNTRTVRLEFGVGPSGEGGEKSGF